MSEEYKISKIGLVRSERSARMVLVSFIFTFVVSRTVVFLIMSRTIPDFYLYLGGSHIHHFNYGIFLLVGVGGYLLFRQPKGRSLSAAAAIYGAGLALTFDEFGMLIHLGGGYWQRASWDAIMLAGALIGLIAFAPSIKRFGRRQWWVTILVGISTIVFFALLVWSFGYAGKVMGPRMQRMEMSAPERR